MGQIRGGPVVRRGEPQSGAPDARARGFVVAREKTNTVVVTPPARVFLARTPWAGHHPFAPLPTTVTVRHVPPRRGDPQPLDADGSVELQAGASQIHVLGTDCEVVSTPIREPSHLEFSFKLEMLGFSAVPDIGPGDQTDHGMEGLAAFQTLVGLPPTGTLDARTAAALQQAYSALLARHP